MIYKMLALNIEGTLLQDNGRLNKSTKEAIEYANDKGIAVTLITSKNFSAANRIAKILKLNTYLVTLQGAFIASQLEKPIFVRKINEDVTNDLVRFLESYPAQIRLVSERFTLSNKLNLPNHLIGRVLYQTTHSFSYSEQFVDSLSEKLGQNPIAPSKVEVKFINEKDLQEAKKAINNMFSEIDCIICDDGTLDIVPAGISKLRGLLYVCDRLNIRREEVVVIGSSVDEIPLIEWAGLGVAMGNASNKVKNAADWITRSNNENGVAYMVKEHFRKQQPLDFLKKIRFIK
ncbi:Cof-type HAD-IIB family hydrolase [Heyndrickxia ginsengihumi]|uniref:HAD family phosphatase n=1 Tax=Heyndrickxia ginsengihumi TaxID=363870 RepID=A0A0A6VAP5_9BACI|nr:Cof-type HAD-IIB family hydrolase [Heyndrickxia ginsengihumi]KHD84578.1 haloacid dehalogenase [Heyndrickxia ginsengihumi]MBE6184862.1 HAD family phosphatase [Bacillus sp. (in: firmicutes)]MCM3022955.1 Cof-type HAD-IIB family hydrolase [Heyndrickxia ginsengihumi]NEY18905.1 HAD family phosphatase [Heyndrickxia ginsengihumi]